MILAKPIHGWVWGFACELKQDNGGAAAIMESTDKGAGEGCGVGISQVDVVWEVAQSKRLQIWHRALGWDTGMADIFRQ